MATLRANGGALATVKRHDPCDGTYSADIFLALCASGWILRRVAINHPPIGLVGPSRSSGHYSRWKRIANGRTADDFLAYFTARGWTVVP